MKTLVPVRNAGDIPPKYMNTPVGTLLEYQNAGRTFDRCTQAQLLVGMCMDNRKHLHIPDNFAFIIRSGGANLRYSEFKVSYAIGVGGIGSIALIGHTQCGMVNLVSRKDQFINGLVERAGWERDEAVEHFNKLAPMFEIGNETEFIVAESDRLRRRHPKILIAPMIYRVEDNLLYLIANSEGDIY